MIENLNFYVVLIVILILIIIYTNLNQSKIYDKLIGGFYEADASFCAESEIDTFCMYLDDDIDSHGTRACYLLMKSGDNLIINEPATAKITQRFSWSNDSSIQIPKNFDIEFSDISDEILDFFPYKQKMKFYPKIGKIVLYLDDTVYATFYKNGINSELKSVDVDDDIEDENDEE